LFDLSCLFCLDGPDPVSGQSVVDIHQRVDGLVGGRDGALQGFLLLRRLGLGKSLTIRISFSSWPKAASRKPSAVSIASTRPTILSCHAGYVKCCLRHP
jgi:hypothetical protein